MIIAMEDVISELDNPQDHEYGDPDVQPLRLWNPNATANWSVLLTPIFGALLIAKNWEALDNPDRAKASRIWLWLTALFLLANLGAIFLPPSDVIDMVFQGGGIGLLASWYFSQGKPQAKLVREELGNQYEKRGLAIPVLTGLAGITVYFGLIFIFVMMTPNIDTKMLADDLRPAIVQQWAVTPGMENAPVHDVTLRHDSGNEYVGYIDTTLNGNPQRIGLRVTIQPEGVAWQTEAYMPFMHGE